MDGSYSQPHRRLSAMHGESEPLLRDEAGKGWRRLRNRRLKQFSLALFVVLTLFFIFIVFFPFSVFLGRYFSERFELRKHYPAYIDLEGGRTQLHFNGSFKVKNTLPIDLMNVALEVDYIYVGVEPFYPLAMSISPELLELDTNQSLTVHLDRDFDLMSSDRRLSSTSLARKRTFDPQQAKKILRNKEDTDFVAYSNWQPFVEENGKPVHSHQMLKNTFQSLPFMSAGNILGGHNNGERNAEKAVQKKGYKTGEVLTKNNVDQGATAQKQNNVNEKTKNRNNDNFYRDGESDEEKENEEADEKEQQEAAESKEGSKKSGDKGVRADPRFESALIAMHQECHATGVIKFHLRVKFFYHIFFNIWRILREQAFEYTMKCATSDESSRFAEWDRREY